MTNTKHPTKLQKRNSLNIVAKNLFDICIATISFYLLGYAVSHFAPP